jgi:hypothetical protein
MKAVPRVPILVLAMTLFFGANGGSLRAAATDDPKAQPKKADVEFNHKVDKSKIYALDLRDRETFLIRVQQTCPDAFNYLTTGVERGTSTRPESENTKLPLTYKDIEVTHDARFGGYVINITPKPGVSAAETCVDGDKLADASFIVSVREAGFGTSFSGGFTVSGLTNPVFSITGEEGHKTLIEEPAKRDTHKLGAGSFVHVFHDKFRFRVLGDMQPAIAFGLGINADSRAEYMLGGAVRLGDKATINVGKAWGSEARLPNGVNLGPVTDTNVLNNLGTRVVNRWFFALTYSFIDTKSRLLKPFAEPTTAAAAPAPDNSKRVDALKALAKEKETYSGVETLVPLFSHLTICKTDVEPVGTSTTDFKITVHLKGMLLPDKAILATAQPLAAAAITTKASAGDTKAVVKSLVFDGTCS